MAKSLVEQYDIIAKEALETELKAIESMDKLYKSMKTVIGESSKFGKIFADSSKVKEYDEAQKRYVKTVEDTIKIEEELITTSSKQKDADLLLAKAKEEKRRYSKAVTDQAKLEIAEQNKEIGTLEKLSLRNKELTNLKRKLDLTTKEGRLKLKEYNKELDKNNAFIKKNSDSLTKQKIGIGDYSQALGPLGRGLQVVNNMFKMLLANPVVAFFVAIGAALIGIIKLFKDTDTFGTKLTGIFEGLKIVWAQFKDAIVNSVKNLGDRFEILSKRAELLKAWLSGDKEAVEKLREEIKLLNDELDKKNPWDGFIKNAKEAAKRVYEVEQALDRLRDFQAASISSQAELYEKFKEYQNLSKDQTLTDRERLKYLDLAKKAAKEYYGNLSKWGEEEFNLEAERTAARFNMKKEEVTKFISLDGEAQMKMMQNDERYANMWNFLTEKGIENLENLFIKSVEARTEYYRRTNELVSLSTGLEKKIQKDATEEIIKTRTDGYKLDEEAFKKSLDEKARVNEKNYNKLKAIRDKENAEQLKQYEDRLALATSFSIETAQIFGKALTDQEYTFAEAARDFLLTNLKMLKAEVQQAIIANSIKATAGAIASGESIATWGIAGLAKAATLVGLIEAAYVGVDALMQKAIPSFYKGTKDTPKGVILVGDHPTKGRSTEIIETPDKKMFEVNKPTLINVPEHSKVYSEEMIKKEFSGVTNKNLSLYGGISESKFEEISEKQTEKIIKGIRNIPQPIYEGVSVIGSINANNVTRYRDRKFRHARRY